MDKLLVLKKRYKDMTGADWSSESPVAPVPPPRSPVRHPSASSPKFESAEVRIVGIQIRDQEARMEELKTAGVDKV